jgi:hypothetical protein
MTTRSSNHPGIRKITNSKGVRYRLIVDMGKRPDGTGTNTAKRSPSSATPKPNKPKSWRTVKPEPSSNPARSHSGRPSTTGWQDGGTSAPPLSGATETVSAQPKSG